MFRDDLQLFGGIAGWIIFSGFLTAFTPLGYVLLVAPLIAVVVKWVRWEAKQVRLDREASPSRKETPNEHALY